MEFAPQRYETFQANPNYLAHGSGFHHNKTGMVSNLSLGRPQNKAIPLFLELPELSETSTTWPKNPRDLKDQRRVKKVLTLLGSRVLSLTSQDLIKVLGRVLDRNTTDLEHQIVATGLYPESPNSNPIELRDSTLIDVTGNNLGVGGQVVIRRESDLARASEVDGEIA
ncbi:hypothetical protein G4B88_027498 [Cannabis sativa]|uniref:Uncharacterized protein n=1 Tax=Cannabis sativa TaxID=3483 RepID=A0A7J6E0U2_CANSA|nr:hypothetical protein G4B88_027498 [Cannabis sativa]